MEWTSIKGLPPGLADVASVDSVDGNIKSLKLTIGGEEYLIRPSWENLLVSQKTKKTTWSISGKLKSTGAEISGTGFETRESAVEAADGMMEPGYTVIEQTE